MKLFFINPDTQKVELTPIVYEVKEFRDVYQEKGLGLKMLSYVYHFTDYNSPYPQNYVEDEHRREKLMGDLNLTADLVDHPLVQAAVQRYEELSETIKVQLLKAGRFAANQTRKYLMDIDYALRDTRGNVLYDPIKVNKLISELPKTIEGLVRLEEQVKKEEEMDNRNVGGFVANRYNE